MGEENTYVKNVMVLEFVSTGRKNIDVRHVTVHPSVSMEEEEKIAGAAEAPHSASTTGENTHANCVMVYLYAIMEGKNTSA